MMEALFDCAGVDQKHRPTNAGIGIVARDVKRDIERQHKEFKEIADQAHKEISGQIR